MLTSFLSDGLKSFLEMCVEEVFVHIIFSLRLAGEHFWILDFSLFLLQ